MPCTHEEAETCIFVPAADAAAEGCNKVVIRSIDSDVLVLAVQYLMSFTYQNCGWLITLGGMSDS